MRIWQLLCSRWRLHCVSSNSDWSWYKLATCRGWGRLCGIFRCEYFVLFLVAIGFWLIWCSASLEPDSEHSVSTYLCTCRRAGWTNMHTSLRISYCLPWQSKADSLTLCYPIGTVEEKQSWYFLSFETICTVQCWQGAAGYQILDDFVMGNYPKCRSKIARVPCWVWLEC